MKKLLVLFTVLLFVFTVAACSAPENTPGPTSAPTPTPTPTQPELDFSEYFTKRDLDWNYDEDAAEHITLADNASSTDSDKVKIEKNVLIVTGEGIFEVTGSLSDGSIVIDAGKDAKVQLVFDNVSLIRKKSAALNVLSADKVFVTLQDGTENVVSRSTKLFFQGEEDIDAAIYSKSDITFNGNGKLTVSTLFGNAITANDVIKFTAGEYDMTSVEHTVDANDAICIYDGKFTVTSGKDAFHCSNKKDEEKGYTVINHGNFTLNTVSDAFDSTGNVTIGMANFTGVIGGDLFKSDKDIKIAGALANASAGEIAVKAKKTVTVLFGDLVLKAPTGFEANDITVNGGTVKVTSTMYSFVAKNDIALCGGYVYAENKNGMSVFEFGGECREAGSTVFAVMGTSAQKPLSSDEICVIMRPLSGKGEAVLSDENGSKIVSFTPENEYSFAIVASPAIKLNQKYILYSGENRAEVIPETTVSKEECPDDKDRFMNIRVKSKDELVAMRNNKKNNTGASLTLYYNGTKMPCSGKGTYYIPVDMTTNEFEGIISTDKNDVYWFSNELMNDKAEALSTNTVFYLTFYEEDYYSIVNVIFTGLPVLTLTEDKSVKVSEGFYGNMEFFDPYHNEYHQTEKASYKYRGASTINYPKRSYRVELDGKLSLCGLRTDDDWVLLSLYDDCGMIRNKYSFDVWNLIAKNNNVQNDEGVELQYVEVIINNSYQGVYALAERIDEKQLELDEDDILYKWNEWSLKSNTAIEVKYPDTVTSETWGPIEEYRQIFFIDKTADMDDAYRMLNMENAVDHTIFCMLAFTQDCLRKNTYFVAEKTDDGYKLKAIPWDMNGSWGCDWRLLGDGPAFMVYHMQAEKDPDCWFSDLYVLFKNCPDEVKALVKARWEELRKTVLTEDNLNAILDKDLAMLKDSGAFARNSGMWQFSTQYYKEKDIYRFVRKRLAFLDEYFADPYLPSGGNLNF